MILALDYSDLSSLIRTTNKLSDELSQYCDKLSSKVQSEMHRVEGGMSSSLNSADYYVNSKINKIREKESNVDTLTSNINALHETAKSVDLSVKQTIESNQTAFFKKHSDLRPADYKALLYSFWTEAKNLPLIGNILEGYEETFDALGKLKDEIAYLWECKGGKVWFRNWVDVNLKFGLAAIAVVAAVGAVAAATTVIGVVVAVAACIAAAIAVVNFAVNAYNADRSVQAYRDGERAMSQIYEGKDSASIALREHNFHNEWGNKVSYFGADFIEVTDQVCGIITITSSLSKIGSAFLTKNGVGFAFKETARVNGELTKVITVKSVWKGTKAMFQNTALTNSTRLGLRTTLLNNIKGSMVNRYDLLKSAMQSNANVSIPQRIKDGINYRAYGFNNASTLEQVEEIAKVYKGTFETADIMMKSVDNNDFSGGINQVVTNQTRNALYKSSDLGKIVEQTGIAYAITDGDNTGTIRAITNPDKGLMQKIGDLFSGEKDEVVHPQASY